MTKLKLPSNEAVPPTAYSPVFTNRLPCIYEQSEGAMAVTLTSIRLDTDLADEAVKVLKAKSRTDAVHIALREIVGLKRFKKLMKKYEGKATFQGHID